jgi:hypothetical protein
MSWGTVELEAEVRLWLEGLPAPLFARAAFYIDLLAERGPLLSEPYTKQIDGKLRELRFYLTGTRSESLIGSPRRDESCCLPSFRSRGCAKLARLTGLVGLISDAFGKVTSCRLRRDEDE